MPRLAIAALAITTCLIAASAAGAAWNQPVGGAFPINHAANFGESASLTTIAGVPYVSWQEYDESSWEVRVARLNAAGTDWEEPVGSESPINRETLGSAERPRIASVGGVPHVVWSETPEVSSVQQIRVARLNAAGTDWEELVGGTSPINHMAAQDGRLPSMGDLDGRPIVAWQEFDGMNSEIRVSRLNASGTAWEKAAAGSAMNHNGTRDAVDPSLAVIGGITYVAWSESDGTNSEIRVARQPQGFTLGWQHTGSAGSPINHSNTSSGLSPSLASIGGIPHVAWIERDTGSTYEVRVARFDAAANDWVELGGASSPINQSDDRSAEEGVSLLDIGGVPHVAWAEADDTNTEIRMSRTNSAGTAWEQVVGGPSPINAAAGLNGLNPFLTQVGGVPYVAWEEADDDASTHVRVARLEPEFLGGSETPTDFGATLTAQVRTFGVPLPVAFEHGPGAGFGSETAPVTVQSGNSDSASATTTVSGLAALTDYSWRAFGTDLARRTSTGPSRGFRTPDTGAPLITGARAVPKLWYVDRRGAPEARVAQRARVGRGTTFRYTLSEASRVVFSLERRTVGRRVGRRCRKQTRRNRTRRRCARYVRAGAFAHDGAAGPNSKRFSGRIGRKRLRAARYRAVLVATDRAGNRSTAVRVAFRVVRG